jgi:hypothetical protein
MLLHEAGRAGVLLAEPVAGMGPGLRAICCSSCLMMTSDRPPGRPLSWLANCWSSISVPMAVPAFSSMPLDWVVARMHFMISFMKMDSNCLATSRVAALGSAPAFAFKAARWAVSATGLWLARDLLAFAPFAPFAPFVRLGALGAPVAFAAGVALLRMPR